MISDHFRPGLTATLDLKTKNILSEKLDRYFQHPDHNDLDIREPDNPKLLANWFNIHDVNHMAAYKVYRKTGIWPMPFLELMYTEDIILGNCWRIHIIDQIIKAWIDHVE